MYPDFGRFKWKLWKNIFLIAFSLIALISGAVVSMGNIIKLYTESDDTQE